MEYIKINVEKLRKLLGSGWLNMDYKRNQYYSEKEKKEIILAERTQLMYTHAEIREMWDECGIKRRKYFKLIFSNKYSFKEILIPKAALYCVEEIEGQKNYKCIRIKIDDFSDIVVEQNQLPMELFRI